jgi:hypothetical protein
LTPPQPEAAADARLLEERASRRASGILAGWRAEAFLAVLCLAAVGIAGTALLAAARLHAAFPLDGGWPIVQEYGELRDGSFDFADWFSQSSEHRPVVARLLLFADLWLGGRQAVSLLLTPLALLVQAVLLVLGAGWVFRGRQGGAAAAVASTAVIAALVFSGAGVETLLVPVRVQSAVGVAAVCGTLAALTLVPAARSRERWGLVAAGLALLGLAQISTVEATAAWPIAVAVLYLRGWPRRHVAVFALATLAVLAAFYFSYARPGGSPGPSELLEDPLESIPFILGVLGSPFEPALGALLARVAGGGYLVVALALAWLRRTSTLPAPASFLAGCIAFALGAALTVAAFHLPDGSDAAHASRHVVFVAPGWAALFALAASARLGTFPRSLDPVAVAAASALVLLSAVPQVRGFDEWDERLGDPDPIVTALQVRVYDPAVVSQLNPGGTLQDFDAAVDVLASHDASVFRDGERADLPGEQLRARFAVAEDICLGFFDAVLHASSPTGAGVAGWAWDRIALRPPELILIVGADGVITGLATTGVARPDVVAALGEVKDENVGWFGYSRPTEGPARAYAVLADGIACPLSGAFPVTPGG